MSHKQFKGDVTQGIIPATLPTLGLLDELAVKNALHGAVFTAVGYGSQDRFGNRSNPLPRMFAFSTFRALTPGYLRSLCRRTNTRVVPGIRVTYPMQLLTLNRLRPDQKYSEDKISPYFWPNGKISVRDDWRRVADNEFQDF